MQNNIYVDLKEAITAVRALRDNCDHKFYDEALMDACSELLGLTPAKVSPRIVGDWLTAEDENGFKQFRCSNCKTEVVAKTRYCPYCGADTFGGK